MFQSMKISLLKTWCKLNPKAKTQKATKKHWKPRLRETQIGWTDSKGGAETREEAGDEHIKPKSSGGTDTWTNLALAGCHHQPFIESWWVMGCRCSHHSPAQVCLMGDRGGGRTKTRHLIHRKTRTMTQRSLLEIWPKQVVKSAYGNIWRTHTHTWSHWMRKPENFNLEIDNQEQETNNQNLHCQTRKASEEETSGDFLPLYVRWMLRVWEDYKKNALSHWNLYNIVNATPSAATQQDPIRTLIY